MSGLRVLMAVMMVGGQFLLTQGCATIRRAREAQNTACVPFGERTVTAAELHLGSNTVLEVGEAVRIGLECHPSVVQARQDLEAAIAQALESASACWPGLSASAGYSRRTGNSEGASGSHDSSDSYSASLGLDVLVYDFGRTPAAVLGGIGVSP